MEFVFWISQTELSATITEARFFCDIMLSHRDKKKMSVEIQHSDVPGKLECKKYFYSTTIEIVVLFPFEWICLILHLILQNLWQLM